MKVARPLETTAQLVPTHFVKVGDWVTLLHMPSNGGYADQVGEVIESLPEELKVMLSSGLLLCEVDPLGVQLCVDRPPVDVLRPVAPATLPAAEADVQSCFFAPFSTPSTEKIRSQAGRLKEILIHAQACSAAMPNWPCIFWAGVTREQEGYGLEADMIRLLQGHGWIGISTTTAPRFDRLKRELSSFAASGGPSHGTGAQLAAGLDVGQRFENPEALNYHLKLPADLQKAGPEIYRSIRAEGYASVRAWINDMFPLDRRSAPEYREFFTSATQIDFATANCQSEQALIQLLATSDSTEIELRKMASYVYQRRTGDRVGANRMLAVRPPGAMSDVAPTWLVDEASVHSKVEWQRTQRSGGGGGRGDGGGKGGGGKGGGGKGDGWENRHTATGKAKATKKKGGGKGGAPAGADP